MIQLTFQQLQLQSKFIERITPCYEIVQSCRQKLFFARLVLCRRGM